MASLLTIYIDTVLRQNPAAAVESCKTLVALFRLLHAKETFVKSYIELLAERLLRQTDLEAESLMASLFTKECGDQFASKTE